MKKILAVLLSIAIIMCGLMGCNDSKKNPSNQTIYYVLEKDPSTLDPQIASDESADLVIMNIFEGLVKIDENNNVVPGVAKSFEANSDYTSFSFHLREDTKWSDEEATPVTANDFVFAFKRALSPQTKSSTAHNLFPIKNAKSINSSTMSEDKLGVYAVDDYTLKIDLEYSYEEFPRVMASPVAMPCNEKLFNNTNGEYGLQCSTIPSNGPFKVKTKYGWEHKKTLIIVRNINYKGETEAIPVSVSFSIGTDTSNLIDNVKKGKSDAGLLSSNIVDEARKEKYNITEFEDTCWGLAFNCQDEIFKNLNMRKAFIQSLSRDYVLNSVPENSKIQNDIVMNTILIDGKNYRDLAGSNLYLDENSNAKSVFNSGMSQLGLKSSPSVTVLCVDEPKVKSMVSRMIEEWNSELGDYFNMQPVSQGKLSDSLQIGDYQIAVAPIQTTGDDPFDTLNKFTTNSLANICQMRDSNFDTMVKKAMDAESKTKIDLCIQSEKYLNSQAVFYPLYCEKRFFASAPNVTGVVFHQYGKGVDFIKTQKIKK